jgi:hypothetical protein
LSIESLCFVIKELLENTTITSGVFQVADDKSLSTNELIQLLGISLAKKKQDFKYSTSFVKGGARLAII